MIAVEPIAIAALAVSALLLLPLRDALLTPLGAGEAALRRFAGRVRPFAALLLVLACILAQSWLVLPWLLATGLDAARAALRLWRCCTWTTASEAAACAFPLVGAAWAFLACAGARPLGFRAEIVLLTAVHFHHAGVSLPMAAARSGSRLAMLLVLLGVPSVAVGITVSQLGGAVLVEAIAVAITASGALLVAARLAQLAAAAPRLAARLWLGTAAAALLGSTMLALAYGLRPWLPTLLGPAPLPLMAATHGALNAFVFGPCALLGLRQLRRD